MTTIPQRYREMDGWTDKRTDSRLDLAILRSISYSSCGKNQMSFAICNNSLMICQTAIEFTSIVHFFCRRSSSYVLCWAAWSSNINFGGYRTFHTIIYKRIYTTFSVMVYSCTSMVLVINTQGLLKSPLSGVYSTSRVFSNAAQIISFLGTNAVSVWVYSVEWGFEWHAAEKVTLIRRGIIHKWHRWKYCILCNIIICAIYVWCHDESESRFLQQVTQILTQLNRLKLT